MSWFHLDLYSPQVDLSQVVLPDGHLESVLAHCRAYDAFIKYIGGSNKRTFDGSDAALNTTGASADKDESVGQNRVIFQSKVAYGNGLVVLLCGKSGVYFCLEFS